MTEEYIGYAFGFIVIAVIAIAVHLRDRRKKDA